MNKPLPEDLDLSQEECEWVRRWIVRHQISDPTPKDVAAAMWELHAYAELMAPYETSQRIH